jgi:hypothetical protein
MARRSLLAGHGDELVAYSSLKGRGTGPNTVLYGFGAGLDWHRLTALVYGLPEEGGHLCFLYSTFGFDNKQKKATEQEEASSEPRRNPHNVMMRSYGAALQREPRTCLVNATARDLLQAPTPCL